MCAAIAAAVACQDVRGGAVEVSWVLRTQGRAVSGCGCSDPLIAQVRIELVGVAPATVAGSAPCADRPACTFACDRRTGATPLDIPPGQYLVSLAALGPGGEDLTRGGAGGARVGVPAPILRDVVWGQATQVGALQIEAGCGSACQTKGGVCAR